MWGLVLLLALLLVIVAAFPVVLIMRDHRRIVRTPGVFRCRVRLVRGAFPGLRRQWRGRPGWATWAHDVLLVHTGRISMTPEVFKVSATETPVLPISSSEVTRLGPKPVSLRLRLDEGDTVEVAAPAPARELLAGPFLVACVNLRTDPRGQKSS